MMAPPHHRRAAAAAAALLLLLAASPPAAASLTLANVFADHMVLQHDGARVWGWTEPGAVVATLFNGTTRLTSPPADAGGLWVQQLPRVAASLAAYSFSFTASTGGSAALDDVLFGEVILASGQSNMVFSTVQAFGGGDAIAGAGAFPGLRLMTVGRRAVPAPLPQLVSVLQPWAVSSPASVRFDGGNFTAFSAVAFFAGASLYSQLGGGVPVGLIVSAYSGTPLQYWTSPDAAGACPPTPPSRGGNVSQLWNGMLAPLAVGPLALSPRSFAWWLQGEDNLGQAPYYTCALPAFIADLRAKFALPASSAFVVVGLSAWPSSGDHYLNLPEMRAAQVATVRAGAAARTAVGYAAAYDQGDVASPWPGHPRRKAPVGARVAAAALGAGWGWSTPYLGPTYASSSAAATPDGAGVVVTVSFDPASVGHAPIVLDASVGCPPPAVVPPATCEGLAVQTSDGAWHADEALALGRTPDGLGLTLTLPALAPGLSVNATRGMFANWPRAYINNTYGFPAVPWNEPLGAVRRRGDA
jgi:sialate O-acetylesterase